MSSQIYSMKASSAEQIESHIWILDVQKLTHSYMEPIVVHVMLCLRITCTRAGNFKFTDKRAGNFHPRVLVNTYTDLLVNL